MYILIIHYFIILLMWDSNSLAISLQSLRPSQVIITSTHFSSIPHNINSWLITLDFFSDSQVLPSRIKYLLFNHRGANSPVNPSKIQHHHREPINEAQPFIKKENDIYCDFICRFFIVSYMDKSNW